MSKIPSKLAGRLRSIDALRGAAAIGVVLYHEIGFKPHLYSGTLSNSLLSPIWAVSSFGYVGVFLFFVISGFCIHLQLARRRLVETNPRANFKVFWKRRIKRLYPPYLCALVIYLVVAGFTTPFKVTALYLWDVVLHLLMLHNLDVRTTYSINGVFWTLAIEEQLYLAYFLLLFLRKRLGWRRTLLVCLGTRAAWLLAALSVEQWAGIRIPIPEAALSHWFTWALGALAVEAAMGIVVLPKWCSRTGVAMAALLAAIGLTQTLPLLQSNKFPHQAVWLLLHPVWGIAFFVVVNRLVIAERKWRHSFAPAMVRLLAPIGLFSYSLYLTHELVIMETYRFEWLGLPETFVAVVIMTPLTLLFGWVFFLCCERPYLGSTHTGGIRSYLPTVAVGSYFPVPVPTSSPLGREPEPE